MLDSTLHIEIDDGTPKDPAYEKRASGFFNEMLWFTEAIADKESKDKSAK